MQEERKPAELWDLYDAAGNPCGTHVRGEKLPEGRYHKTVSIFTVNSRRELLLTRRAPEKTYGGQLEVTAGSVLAGESEIHAACRELEEETGIRCEPDELILLDTMVDVPYHWSMTSYFLKKDVPLEEIRLQPGETTEARWVPLDYSLTEDRDLAWPVRKRLLLYWRELNSFENPKSRMHPWIDWAKELQSLAQQGIQYTKDPYDEERFRRISEIACEIMSEKTGISKEKMLGLFANETGYQTPKVETRAAVFDERDRVLLVRERATGLWSMPGGWCDIGIGLGENCVKECMEEAGVRSRAVRLLAVENRSAHDYTPYPYEILKCYVLCEALGGTFEENVETVDARYFSLDELPPLSLDRVTERSIRDCLEAAKHPERPTFFD